MSPRDENPRLPEWIAYHYQVLPLRSLIVSVDPASRSSPNEILLRWYSEMRLQVMPLNEKYYLPPKMRGPCNSTDPEQCLWRHRDRQQVFIMKCMAEFKKMNKTWVLLTDVDEYIQFNQLREDDPPPPLDGPPKGSGEMRNWKDQPTKIPNTFVVSGMIDALGWNGGEKFARSDIVFRAKDAPTLTYGSLVKDIRNVVYFLRDDIAYREKTALPAAPPGIPTIKEPFFSGASLYGRVYNDTYNNEPDGQFIPIPMDWKNGDMKMRSFSGGHLFNDTRGRVYFLENDHKLWPPHYLAKDIMAARSRLPAIGEGSTILEVLKSEAKQSYTKGALGPCLSIPRLLYGSKENNETKKWAPDGFDDEDFLTLRYGWHASKGAFEASKYGKTIIDVSRIPEGVLNGKKALNIHRPLAYYCRKDPPRYEMSLFRVNHYLDSFEAYSYRNDARAQRQCKECYEKKGSGAAVACDDDIRPWLKQFVANVGYEKAKKLLAGAGDFVTLPNVTQLPYNALLAALAK
ncbi:hypothetical protein ACHAXT_010577 [Thalassiosira profunda]